MVATLVFANANAWSWYLGHNLRAPCFFQITHQKIDSQYPVPIWYRFNLLRFDAGAAAISRKFA
jgi:hypothetical protein